MCNLIIFPFRFLILIFSIIIYLVSYGLLYAGVDEKVEVEGYAVVVSGNKEIARDKAVYAALKSAIEQAVGVRIESDTLVKNFELINDRIYAQTAGFIKRYKIIREIMEGDSIRVQIEAVVATANLEQELDAIGILIKAVGNPRIMLLISEQNVTQEKPSPWWVAGDTVDLGIIENTLITRFHEKKFDRFVDREAVLQGIKKNISKTGSLSHDINNDMAMRLASEGEAELVIVGRGIAKSGQPIMGTSIRSIQANISARVISPDSGEVLASFTTSAVAAHVDSITGGSEALKKAANELSDKLISQILSKWQKKMGGANTVKLVIPDIKFDKLADFKIFLKSNIIGVVDIYERSFRDNIAKIDVDFKGTARALAQDLSSKIFNGNRIEIISLTGNAVEIRLVKQ
ncbi:MAG: flagellar assembly protein T N-terminal domain-containing protein [Deltaproteobacteria bacterium]|nr:flagellar assembly protein T N-terminal domain-containing protein [Deltaproteobacteria bacterium]